MLLARHGQSEWNALGRWQGQADPPLSELGRRQAIAAAERLGTVDAIVASDLDRAMTTAAIIAETLGVGPVLVEPRLRERSAGEWSGLTRVEIEEQWPGYLAERRRPPGFESDESLLTRTVDALGDLARAHPEAELLVVTHGGVVYVLESDAGLPFARLPNLSGRWLAHDGETVRLGERIELVDESAVDDDSERV
jgi:probable phosphoglycerate mutase